MRFAEGVMCIPGGGGVGGGEGLCGTVMLIWLFMGKERV